MPVGGGGQRVATGLCVLFSLTFGLQSSRMSTPQYRNNNLLSLVSSPGELDVSIQCVDVFG